MEETFCEYLIKWKNNEKSQGMFQAGGDGKQVWEALLGTKVPRWAMCNAMVWCGNKWWRTELDHSIHQHSEAILCTTSLMHAHVGFPRSLSYSWLEAIAIWLRKRLWIGPDLFPSLQIWCYSIVSSWVGGIWMWTVHFVMLEQHKLLELSKVTRWWSREIIKVLEEH